MDEVNITDKQLIKNNKLYQSLPSQLKQYAYNKGGALFGWSIKLLIPILFLFAGALAMTPASWLPGAVITDPLPPSDSTFTGTITDLSGKEISDVIISSKSYFAASSKGWHFHYENPRNKAS